MPLQRDNFPNPIKTAVAADVLRRLSLSIFVGRKLIAALMRREDAELKRPPNGGRRMRDYTTREKLKITAGAVASLVIVGWAVVLAIAFLSAR